MNNKIITLDNLKVFKNMIDLNLNSNKTIKSVSASSENTNYIKCGNYFIQDTDVTGEYYDAVTASEDVTLTVTYSDNTQENYIITARSLTSFELATIPIEERSFPDGIWSITYNGDSYNGDYIDTRNTAMYVTELGSMNYDECNVDYGIRLGFKDPFEGFIILNNNYEIRGDYVFRKTIIPNKDYYEACETTEDVGILYFNYNNSFIYNCTARTLSKSELEVIKDEFTSDVIGNLAGFYYFNIVNTNTQRDRSYTIDGKLENGELGAYWTSTYCTPLENENAYIVNFEQQGVYFEDDVGFGSSVGALLGFKNPFIKFY